MYIANSRHQTILRSLSWVGLCKTGGKYQIQRWRASIGIPKSISVIWMANALALRTSPSGVESFYPYTEFRHRFQCKEPSEPGWRWRRHRRIEIRHYQFYNHWQILKYLISKWNQIHDRCVTVSPIWGTDKEKHHISDKHRCRQPREVIVPVAKIKCCFPGIWESCSLHVHYWHPFGTTHKGSKEYSNSGG